MISEIEEVTLTAYALGELDAEESARIEARLAGCPEARAFVDEQREIAALVGRDLEIGDAVGLSEARRAALLAELRRPRRSWLRVAQVAAAAAFLAAIVGPWAFSSGSRPPVAPVSGPAVRPEIATVETVKAEATALDELATAALGVVTAQPQIQLQFGVDGAALTTGATFLEQSQTLPVDQRAFVGFMHQVDPNAVGTGTVVRALRESERILALSTAAANPAVPGSAGEEVVPSYELRAGLGIVAPNAEQYEVLVENAFLDPKQSPHSTFGLDVDTGAWSNLRRFLQNGQLPPPGAVRIEEMVNYFSYSDVDRLCADGGDDKALAAGFELAPCPWNPAHRLLRIVVRGKAPLPGPRQAANLVFLVDVSGSMQSADKLPLLKEGLKLMVAALDEGDTVTLVTYSGTASLALPPTSCEVKAGILAAIDALAAGGSTNGQAGLQLAYEQARAAFHPGGNNRVVLCTDGDFNVGTSDKDGLVALIEREAKSGVFLSVLGFGTGNLKESNLESIADRGNGHYAYVDGLREAKRQLVERLVANLVVVAKDAKIQIEFNPAAVASYRLLGYENRTMAARDFRDDTKDGGEVGAGHQVTALYEVVPAGLDEGDEPRRYSAKGELASAIEPQPVPVAVAPGELGFLKLRWKGLDGAPDGQIEKVIPSAAAEVASDELRFASAVAAFGLVLRQSAFRGSMDLDRIAAEALGALGEDLRGERIEFVDLVRKAKTLGSR